MFVINTSRNMIVKAETIFRWWTISLSFFFQVGMMSGAKEDNVEAEEAALFELERELEKRLKFNQWHMSVALGDRF